MSIPQRTFDRAVVAKLSDTREHLHDLLERAARERSREPAAGYIWPRDINDATCDAEVSCG